MADEAKDYLAVINVMGTGSWARGPDKEKAVKDVIRIFKRDFKTYFVLKKGTKLHIDLLDVTGHDNVTWDETGYWSNDKGGKPFEPTIERIVHVLERTVRR